MEISGNFHPLKSISMEICCLSLARPRSPQSPNPSLVASLFLPSDTHSLTLLPLPRSDPTTGRVVFGDGHPAIDYLLLLAVADDFFGILIIAFFYQGMWKHTRPLPWPRVVSPRLVSPGIVSRRIVSPCVVLLRLTLRRLASLPSRQTRPKSFTLSTSS